MLSAHERVHGPGDSHGSLVYPPNLTENFFGSFVDDSQRELELDDGDRNGREKADQDHNLHDDPETGHTGSVTIGAAIFLAAIGAILRYAVSDQISGIDLQTIGTILIVAGVVGLIAGMAMEMSSRRSVRDDRDRPRGDRY